MRFIVLSASLVSLIFSSTIEDNALNYLNSLREKAGLRAYSMQENLQRASLNHVNYMSINEISHEENSTKSGYTGTWPTNRAYYEDYQSAYVSENLTAGEQDYKESIDDLFSAIYHRFGFLNLELDEIGIAIQDNMYYNYDIGNSRLNELCSGSSYSGSGSYYKGVCKDYNLKISQKDYADAKDYLKLDAPKMILWPPANSTDIPPVFYEEHPDPLPNSSVSGYPISINFNDKKTDNSIEVNSFTLRDSNNQNVEILKKIDVHNDPHLSAYDFAIFPKNRLEWGSVYYAKVNYSENGQKSTKEWCFSTRSLNTIANRFYRIDSSNKTIHLISNVKYVLYFVPRDNNDYLGGYSATRNVDSMNSGYIDQNTIYLTLKGKVGDFAELNFENGVRLKAVIDTKDSASIPKNDSCNKKEFTNISYTISYGNNKNALIMPKVKKVFIYNDNSKDTIEVEDSFNNFPSYNNSQVCFDSLKDNNSTLKELENRCFDVDNFYIQKIFKDPNSIFMLYNNKNSKLYEGVAGYINSFKLVKDGDILYNENSLTNDNYSGFTFDKRTLKATIKY